MIEMCMQPCVQTLRVLKDLQRHITPFGWGSCPSSACVAIPSEFYLVSRYSVSTLGRFCGVSERMKKERLYLMVNNMLELHVRELDLFGLQRKRMGMLSSHGIAVR